MLRTRYDIDVCHQGRWSGGTAIIYAVYQYRSKPPKWLAFVDELPFSHNSLSKLLTCKFTFSAPHSCFVDYSVYQYSIWTAAFIPKSPPSTVVTRVRDLSNRSVVRDQDSRNLTLSRFYRIATTSLQNRQGTAVNLEDNISTQRTSSNVFMSADATTDTAGTARRVLVTGASGRTGGIVFEKLLAKEGYATRGMVRNEQVSDNIQCWLWWRV